MTDDLEHLIRAALRGKKGPFTTEEIRELVRQQQAHPTRPTRHITVAINGAPLEADVSPELYERLVQDILPGLGFRPTDDDADS